MGDMKVCGGLVVALVFGLIDASAQHDTNIWRVDTSSHHQRDNSDTVLDNYSENMLPLLSRDLTLLEHAIEMIGDEACREQCKLVMSEIHNFTTWATRFYDASGKFPDGILGGSSYQLGNFDECLAIGENDGTPKDIYGQYCLGEIGIQVPNAYLEKNDTIWREFQPATKRSDPSISKLYWGICVPSACEPRDVENVVRTILDVAFIGSHLKLTPKIPERSCYTKTPLIVNNLTIVYTAVLAALVGILIVATFFDVIYFRHGDKMPKGTLSQALLSFSFLSNLRKLCSGAQENGVSLDCVAGIRVLSMAMIITGHTLIFMVGAPAQNDHYWLESVTKVEYSIFLNNPLLVDTFLLLSGFLASSLVLYHLHKGQSINFLLLYLVRYLRLTPAYLIMIGLYVTWLPQMDSGPLWYRVYVEKERCEASWWANLLYVNNYVNADQLCMFQSWYLSVDTQLFVLAPLIIYPLHKWRRFGETLLAVATVASVVIPFVLTLSNSWDPTLLVYKPEMSDLSTNTFFKNSYIKTHMRASSYCFGLACGYLIHRIKLSGYKMPKKIVKIGWTLAMLSLVASMFTIVIFYGPRTNFTPMEAAIYACLHRAFWCLGTGWVLIACITSNGGIAAKILTWKAFVPLSRLTYSAYLINGMVELHSVSTLKTPFYLGTMTLIRECTAHVMITFAGAFVLSMMFESPILGLEKVLLRPERRRKSPEDNKNVTEETESSEA